jgi:hypothetical protein
MNLWPQNGLEKPKKQNTEFDHKETKEAAYEHKYYEPFSKQKFDQVLGQCQNTSSTPLDLNSEKKIYGSVLIHEGK